MRKKIRDIAFIAPFVAFLGLAGGGGVLPLRGGAVRAQTPPAASKPSAPLPAPVLSHEVAQAVEDLQNARYFAMTEVGIARQTSPGESALNVLVNEKNADALFRNLLKTATPAGQLYALMGLRRTAGAAEFAAAVAPFRTRKDPILTFSGCFVITETLGAIVSRMENGGFVVVEYVSSKPTPAPHGDKSKP